MPTSSWDSSSSDETIRVRQLSPVPAIHNGPGHRFTPVFDRIHSRDDHGISGAAALDATDMAGVNFKHVDRNKYMMNLARNEVDILTEKGDRQTAKATLVNHATIEPPRCIFR
ncbi:hypothetical protein DPSP01_014519 [Paraphaeosphaeria sporulosa]|uniref:Uncharacterized protein n=1 Tax=Paraphaeosphaeria sporulosa TaxID=1460663 RepID=A0A177CP77_9PLEO|nr:uncharacterized protein CC84DRAFT_1234687 [Paraphaeosphaeria sporulosa]OAG09314.1 hypothetical protein CC84DRAFT_1234687 [Paraphaeosphaeria sporulosa]